MKRDTDLVRQILIEIEKQPFTGGWIRLEIDDYDCGEISYGCVSFQ